jgi:hypothetical protein
VTHRRGDDVARQLEGHGFAQTTSCDHAAMVSDEGPMVFRYFRLPASCRLV